MSAQRDAYYESLKPHALAPLWTVLDALVTPEPRTPIVPYAWRYDALRPLLMQSGGLISAQEAVRRVLILENPALAGHSCITRTLYAGLQLILPGEIAPCHRHTQSALRFILEGQGAYTAVDGERAMMEPFDLVLTPNWRWHDHGNDSDQPMVWLDGLDIPLVTALDASFAQTIAGGIQHAPSYAAGDCKARYGANLRPMAGPHISANKSPLFHYTFKAWRAALMACAASSTTDPYDGVAMEFTNPADGGAVMNTISAFCQFLPQGFEGQSQQSTDALIMVGVEGEGVIFINDAPFSVGPRDVVVIPCWAKRRFQAQSDLVLFSYSDRTTQQKLGLWRQVK